MRTLASTPGGGAAGAAPAASGGAAAPLTDQEQEDRFHEAYAKAYTVSQLYNVNRPPPVPPTEYEERRKKNAREDILASAKKQGKSQDAVRSGLDQLEALLPNVVDLNRMKPADWVGLAANVSAVAAKLILLRTLYPNADVFSMVIARPKTLLLSETALEADAAEVQRLLASAKDVCAIVQAVPELTDPIQLGRSLVWLRAAFPGQDTIAMLQENPLILRNIGESNVEDSAEYGEMTTKD
ncbi:MAG: hypothetical protein J3K34DRAFT_519785 [Monoraphidium minutum]|nr:MAG: hypothetical protein J3K34DRAFT_519785 [Monoraphidium minutum]